MAYRFVGEDCYSIQFSDLLNWTRYIKKGYAKLDCFYAYSRSEEGRLNYMKY